MNVNNLVETTLKQLGVLAVGENAEANEPVAAIDVLRQQVAPIELQPSLEFLYERIVLDGGDQENWQQALVEMRLSLVEHTMD